MVAYRKAGGEVVARADVVFMCLPGEPQDDPQLIENRQTLPEELARENIDMGRGLSQLQARVLECLPGPLMSRDNLASMERDNVCDGGFPAKFGFAPTALEALDVGLQALAARGERVARSVRPGRGRTIAGRE